MANTGRWTCVHTKLQIGLQGHLQSEYVESYAYQIHIPALWTSEVQVPFPVCKIAYCLLLSLLVLCDFKQVSVWLENLQSTICVLFYVMTKICYLIYAYVYIYRYIKISLLSDKPLFKHSITTYIFVAIAQCHSPVKISVYWAWMRMRHILPRISSDMMW